MNADTKYSIFKAISQTLSAAMFLSRLPLNSLAKRVPHAQSDTDFGETTRYFGFAAIIVALPSAAVLWICEIASLPPAISAILTIICLVITTGALHEDALADVADGFGGGKTIEDKLMIMRDSQIGSFGASALILSFILHLALLTYLIERIPANFSPLIIILANIVTTVMIIGPWVAYGPARTEEGLSKSHGMPTTETMATAMITGIPFSLFLGWVAIGFFQTLFAIVACFIVCAAFSIYCNKQIGGHTGDTLGATKKISELALLFAMIVVT